MFAMMTMMSTSGLMVASFSKDFGITAATIFGMGALPLALTMDRFTNGLTRPFFGWVSDRIGREPHHVYRFRTRSHCDDPMVAYTRGSIFGGPLAARLHEASGSWLPVFAVVISLDVLTALLAISVLKPVRHKCLRANASIEGACQLARVTPPILNRGLFDSNDSFHARHGGCTTCLGFAKRPRRFTRRRQRDRSHGGRRRYHLCR
jgi:hypothetical protein